MADVWLALLALAGALAFASLVLLVWALLDFWRHSRIPPEPVHRHVDVDRVQAHVAWPWHEDAIEFEVRHRNGTGQAPQDARQM